MSAGAGESIKLSGNVVRTVVFVITVLGAIGAMLGVYVTGERRAENHDVRIRGAELKIESLESSIERRFDRIDANLNRVSEKVDRLVERR